MNNNLLLSMCAKKPHILTPIAKVRCKKKEVILWNYTL